MRRYILFLIYLCAALCLLSCESENSPELSVDDYKKILSGAVSSGNLPADRFDELDPYESYFLSLKTAEAGFPEAAVKLARHCWENTDGLISERAAELAVTLLFENEDYSEAEFLSSVAAAKFPDNYRLLRSVAEAAYWQHRNEAVLNSLSELSSFPESRTDHELTLFRAVSAFRMNSDGWEKLWIDLFRETPASTLIIRGWDYLTFTVDDPYSYFPGYERLFRAKYLQSSGSYRESESMYREWLENDKARGITPVIIRDIEQLFIQTGNSLSGAMLLESAGIDDEEGLFAAARLYRRAGKYPDAQRCMEQFFEKRGDNDLSDRELWYSLDIKVRRNLSSALDSLDYYTGRWDDADFFADSLDALCTNLARRRRWADVLELARKLEHSGPASVFDRCRYISERAAGLGYIPPPGFTGPYNDIYYRILSGDNLDDISSAEFSGDVFAVCNAGVADFLNEYELYIDGLIRYGLGDLLSEVDRYKDQLSESFLIRCARETAARGNPLDSIRIMYRFSGRYTPAGLAALYPDLYRVEIEAAAEKSGIAPQLLFGLVWKESGFENDIVSRSGAVGLSQLMPATADDISGRMGFRVRDLTNPVENLSIGAWYLDWLIDYVGNTSAAVLSYNGGPGRVRGWLRSFSDLPEDLFYEIVPVQETHLYGKNVLTAAVIYGLLYYQTEPEQTLKIFFKEE